MIGQNMTDQQYSKYINPIEYPPGVDMPPSTRMTSRRAKNIESKLLRQIAIVGVITVVLAVVFILVVIPNVIKLMANNGSVPAGTVQDTSVPPQTPIIAAPVDATNSAQITLKGYSQKGNKIVILDNSTELQRGDAADDGSFSIDVQLQTGDNSLTAYAINSAQKESQTSQAYLVKYDTEPPKLDISDPQDNASINGSKNQQLSIKGVTDPGSHVSLNDGIVFVKSDGSFVATFQLNNGDNALDIKATDPAGNINEKKLTVHFSP